MLKRMVGLWEIEEGNSYIKTWFGRPQHENEDITVAMSSFGTNWRIHMLVDRLHEQ